MKIIIDHLTQDQIDTYLKGKADQKLLAYGVEVLGEYVNSSTRIELKCQRCDHTWTTSPLAKLQGIKNAKTPPGEYAGCPKCNRQIVDDRKRKNSDTVTRLKAAGYSITDDYTNITTRCTLIKDATGERLSRIPSAVIAAYEAAKGNYQNNMHMDETEVINQAVELSKLPGKKSVNHMSVELLQNIELMKVAGTIILERPSNISERIKMRCGCGEIIENTVAVKMRQYKNNEGELTCIKCVQRDITTRTTTKTSTEVEDMLAAEDFKIIGEYTKMKDHHDLECLRCGSINRSTILAKTQAFKHGRRGCKECIRRENWKDKWNNNLEIIKQQGVEPMDPDYIGQLTAANHKGTVKFRGIECGHEFEVRPQHLITYRNGCTVCGIKKRARNLTNSASKRMVINASEAEKYKQYKNEVSNLTQKTYKQYISELNPSNVVIAPSGTEDGYQLDHIVPIKVGYLLKMSPEDMSQLDNLQLLTWQENNKKSDYVPEQLPEWFEQQITDVQKFIIQEHFAEDPFKDATTEELQELYNQAREYFAISNDIKDEN